MYCMSSIHDIHKINTVLVHLQYTHGSHINPNFLMGSNNSFLKKFAAYFKLDTVFLPTNNTPLDHTLV